MSGGWERTEQEEALTPLPEPVVAPAYTPPRTNKLAVTALVFGIIWVFWIGSALAILFGYMAKRQIDEGRGEEDGREIAVAAIVLGWIGIGLLVLFLLGGRSVTVGGDDGFGLGG